MNLQSLYSIYLFYSINTVNLTACIPIILASPVVRVCIKANVEWV